MAAVRIRLAPLLYSYTRGLKTVEVDAATVGEALTTLDKRYPGIAFRIVDEQQTIRPHVNVFLGENKVQDLSTPIGEGSELYIVGALSGG